jgi:cation:H+ antiporter
MLFDNTINTLLYVVSFVLIWYGSGLIVAAASKFSSGLRLSAFAFSFIFLGLLTSIPELSVGLQAVADNDPEIFVGNLLGGIIVLFLFVIPLLAVFGNGISLKHELDKKTLLGVLAVILLPSLVVLDKQITNYEGGILVVAYVALLYLVEHKNGILDQDNKRLLNAKAYSLGDIIKIILGIILVFISSNIIVEKTVYFADIFNVSAFYISLIIIALGTNLPELSLAVRSVVSGNREVAMGDYLGSAAVNTILFGIFTLLSEGEVITVNNFVITFIFITTALVMFYVFFSTKKFISRANGLALLGIYVIFIVFEILRV